MNKYRVAGRRLARMTLALTIAAMVPATAAAQREGSFERTLTVGSSPEVEISAGSGRIEVRAGSTNRVEISGRIRAGDWGSGWFGRTGLSSEERVRRVEANPPVEQSGNRVRIGYFTSEDWRNGVSISFTIVLPAGSNVIARTGSGSQQIEAVSGTVESHAGSGSLTLKDIGARLRASTGSGSIRVDGVRGALQATTGSGSIRGTGIAGAITAKSSSGGIDIEQVSSGEVDVSSSSGTVRVRGIRGALQASTSSGRLIVDGEVADDWRLSASSGSIRIHLPRSQGFDLDATTRSGSIDVDFPVTAEGTTSRRSLRGSAQGGGPLLHVRTSSGRISIGRTQGS
jgi:hypothetical protein